MYNSIVKAVRKTISADKNRYENEEYDLDLTYITERVIAMSFPADGVESAYRNSIYDVSKLLNTSHKDHYLIYNLSERKYDYSLFNGMVLDWCGFPDHHAPPLGLLFKIVMTIYSWLEKDPMNVVVVHCMAGKGRTGTVISALLQYGGLFEGASDAMRYFAVKRSNNNYGITGPSQIRYTQYFSDIYFGGKELNPGPVFLKSISMVTLPKFFLGPLKQGVCPVLNIYSATQKGVRIFTSAPIEGDTKETRTYQSGNATIVFEVRKIVRGDILLVFSHITPFYRVEQICRANFHTGMFSFPTLILTKSDLDGADGDKRFSSDFHLRLDFQEVVNQNQQQQQQLLNSNNGDLTPYIIPANAQTSIEYQKEIKKEIKWIRHEAIAKKDHRNGSIFFLPSNNSEKIKQAKDTASKQGTFGVHSGYLFKKGHNFKSWRRRWFVLKDNILSYYKSPKDTAPAGIIPINEIVNIEIECEISQAEGYDYCFQISTSKANYLISAENERDLEDWTEILRSAKRMVQSTGRLFIEILEVKYQPNMILADRSFINNPQPNGVLPLPIKMLDINDHPIDIITYVTVHLGKKRDTTSHKSVLYNPVFMYAGDFPIYDDEPSDLVVSLWVRSSVQNIKDTLAAEFILKHNQLTNKYNTDWRDFNRIKSNLLSKMSLKIGMAYGSEVDIQLSEIAKGSSQQQQQQSSSSLSASPSSSPHTSTNYLNNKPHVSFNHSIYNNSNILSANSNSISLSNSLNFNTTPSSSTTTTTTTATNSNVSTSLPQPSTIYLAKSREENKINNLNSSNNSNTSVNSNLSRDPLTGLPTVNNNNGKQNESNKFGYNPYDEDDEDKLIEALQSQLNDTEDDEDLLLSTLKNKLDDFDDEDGGDDYNNNNSTTRVLEDDNISEFEEIRDSQNSN
ncbi:hypothetical protein DDB_G0289979 [Dictyostelium discoideum AX4]|uniref:Phosphatidylinositol-3,4,5-trisphosphate 3-phosphatase n=1 Tax=Dictyostelium discoideum TaxID=44689 RepID=Q54GT8_DICDI|nr:hypothetical protein DDB_G0289979 [Dictyostelium discoideum AX4]EAL62502.1 hypothetical protein DDB_G0289979 [Dictyostelium discoideum AX4]|eukprot:XP_635981.1 hypothetical protein DDB_G0289979 [Dictyostelium discoideum AX4]